MGALTSVVTGLYLCPNRNRQGRMDTQATVQPVVGSRLVSAQ